jgi:hypothetical protein
MFAPLTVEAGARRTVHTTAVFRRDPGVGARTLHRVQAGQLTPAAVVDALIFAEWALGLLLTSRPDWPQERQIPCTARVSVVLQRVPLTSGSVGSTEVGK